MEKCILTGKLLNNSQVVDTEVGPISISLWGRDPIKYDNYGLALLPVKLLPKYREIVGTDPPPDVLEDSGKCLK